MEPEPSNWTQTPGVGDEGETVNEAVGGWLADAPTVIVRVVVSLAPSLSVTVRRTV